MSPPLSRFPVAVVHHRSQRHYQQRGSDASYRSRRRCRPRLIHSLQRMSRRGRTGSLQVLGTRSLSTLPTASHPCRPGQAQVHDWAAQTHWDHRQLDQ